MVALAELYHKVHEGHKVVAMEGYGLPDMRQTECLRLFLVFFVPFVVGNMNGLNAHRQM